MTVFHPLLEPLPNRAPLILSFLPFVAIHEIYLYEVGWVGVYFREPEQLAVTPPPKNVSTPSPATVNCQKLGGGGLISLSPFQGRMLRLPSCAGNYSCCPHVRAMSCPKECFTTALPFLQLLLLPPPPPTVVEINYQFRFLFFQRWVFCRLCMYVCTYFPAVFSKARRRHQSPAGRGL